MPRFIHLPDDPVIHILLALEILEKMGWGIMPDMSGEVDVILKQYLKSVVGQFEVTVHSGCIL